MLPFTIGNCVRTVIHPNWTVVGGASKGDLALCVLKEPSNYTTVAIPKGEWKWKCDKCEYSAQ